MKGNAPKHAGLLLVIALVVPVAIGLHAHVRGVLHREEILNRYRPARSVALVPDQFEVNASYWVGRAVPKGKTLVAWLLEEDLWWEMRINQDDNRIVQLYPINHPKAADTVITTGKVGYIEWRLHPGQKKSVAKAAYEIRPSH